MCDLFSIMREDWLNVEYCWAMTDPLRPEPMMQLSYCFANMSSSFLLLIVDEVYLEDVSMLLRRLFVVVVTGAGNLDEKRMST